jgi:hypothetical protein
MKHEAEQFGLFSDGDMINMASKQIWKKREVDRLLDFYLSGADLGRIAASLKRNRKAIVRKLQEYIYNERDRVTNYKPRQRTSRAGKRLTPNERQLIQECRKKKVPDTQIAAVLARPIADLDAEEIPMQKAKAKNEAPFTNTLNLILAHRYIYHIYKTPVISNATYDALKKEEQRYGPQTDVWADRPRHIPTHVKTLAVYLIEQHKFTKKR